MIGSFRKFSSSIYAKILLAIIIIPFVFWGMGSNFKSGDKNIIVTVEDDKYTTKEFVNYLQQTTPQDLIINDNIIQNQFANFIGDKLIQKEIEKFNILLTDRSLSSLVKHQKQFKRENKFSRIEYEKFLVKNNITPSFFESNLSNYEKKKQLMSLIGGGIMPPNFLINMSFDDVNQKRDIEIINLDLLFKKNFNFTEEEIKKYFESNKESFKETFKTTKHIELTPEKFTGDEEFNDLFFKKIDEIDDSLIQGKDFNYIIDKYNLPNPKNYTFNKSGKNKNSEVINNFPKFLIEQIFNLDDSESTFLIESSNKYFLIEVNKTESFLKKINDESVKKEILINLENKVKRKITSELINRINSNSFKKYDFDKLAKSENLPTKKITINGRKDDKNLKKEIINQIYLYPQKKVIIVNAIGFSETYLVYINKIHNVTINENSEEYNNYVSLSENKMKESLFSTYDIYLRKKYKIDINYPALETVKDYYKNQ